jgi:hypothetical protein
MPPAFALRECQVQVWGLEQQMEAFDHIFNRRLEVIPGAVG